MLNNNRQPFNIRMTPKITRTMFSPAARFFTVERMPLVWDESKLWLIGREGKILSPDQEQPWTSAPGTVELTWEQFAGSVDTYWKNESRS